MWTNEEPKVCTGEIRDSKLGYTTLLSVTELQKRERLKIGLKLNWCTDLNNVAQQYNFGHDEN